MASVLIMLTLILGVIFVYAGAMLTQSELMKHREKRLKAQYLAESGLAEAIARFRFPSSQAARPRTRNACGM